MTSCLFDIRGFTVSTSKHVLLDSVNLEIPAGGVYGLIGPSGAGKTTLLKSLNRLVQLTPGLKVGGQIDYNGSPIYHRCCDPDHLRTKVGMLFQQPAIFPVSVLANVLFGVRHHTTVLKRHLPDIAEKALAKAGLWQEVRDRLNVAASTLSIGQQQRLCLARTLACCPETILMDEPTSALDPRSARTIEELIAEISREQTIILVTHNPDQARRLCSRAAHFASGSLRMSGHTDEVLTFSEQYMQQNCA